jgi:hypothetical protein
MWMPSSPSGARRPIASVIEAPWSPPWAELMHRLGYTRYVAQARAMRPGFQPISAGSAEKP